MIIIALLLLLNLHYVFILHYNISALRPICLVSHQLPIYYLLPALSILS